MNKSVGTGIPGSCTHPNNFLTMRAVYPPAREIKQTQECHGTVLVLTITVYIGDIKKWYTVVLTAEML